MQLLLFTLMTFLVGSSHQQAGAIWIPFIMPHPMCIPGYSPLNLNCHHLVYADDNVASRNLNEIPDVLQAYPDRSDGQEMLPLDWETQSRVNTRLVPLRQGNNGLEQQKRFFFGSGNAFNPTINPFSVFYRTTLLTSTSTSVIPTPVFISCIPSTQFVSSAIGITCPQRKRHARELLYDPDFSPSKRQAQTVTPTAIASLDNKRAFHSGIASSLNALEMEERQGRGLFYNYVVTLTTTTTVYQFNATTIKKTVAPASAASALTCIPFGFTIC